MFLTLNVTKNDIKLSKAKNPEKCPITRALKKLVKKKCFVSTGIWLTWVEGFPYVKLTKKARTFINRFDDGKEVKPDMFTISFPNEYRECLL